MFLKKFIKTNIKYLMLFILILTSSFSLSNIFISNSSENTYMDVKRNIEIGEIYFFSANSKSLEEFENYFHSEVIPACASNLFNNIYIDLPSDVGPSSSSLTNLPILFMDGYDYDLAIIDYPNFLYNKSPKICRFDYNFSGKFEFNICQTNFSSVRGIFLSYDFYLDNELKAEYYAIKATNENKELIARYCSDSYYGFYDYGESISPVMSNSNESISIVYNQKIATYLSIAIAFIYLVIFISFLNKNRNDLYLLYLNGYSKTKTMLFIFVLPIVSLIISLLLTLGVSNIYVLLYNSLISKYTPAIEFGRLNFIMIILAIFIILMFSLAYGLYFKHFKLNRGEYND